MTEHLTKLRALIVAAVPELEIKARPEEGRYQTWVSSKIELASVLRAVDIRLSSFSFSGFVEEGIFGFPLEEYGGMKWNLSLPLDDQLPEVHEFLLKVFTNE